MARVSAEERREAVTVIAGTDYNPEDDIADSFEGWRTATEEAQVPGKVTVWQIPMDDHGIPQPSSKNQLRLGAWPIDAYKFDDLCDMLVKNYMTPEKILCVRLIGSKAGERGVQFNRVVILRAPAESKTNGAGPAGGESLSVLLKAFQEGNERMVAMMQRMQPPPNQSNAHEELARILQVSALINKPMQDMMAMLVPALIGRPVPAATDPFAGLSGIIDVAGKLADLKGEGGGGGNGPDWLEAIKAIVPVAKPAIEALAASRMAPPPPQRPAITAPPPGSVPTPQPAPTAQPTQGAASLSDIPSGDIEVFNQLKPQIDALVKMAQDGGDPSGAADLMFDNMINVETMPDELYDKIGEMFDRDNLVSQLAAFHAGVLQHRAFFETFRKRVQERYDQETAEASNRPTNLQGVG